MDLNFTTFHSKTAPFNFLTIDPENESIPVVTAFKDWKTHGNSFTCCKHTTHCNVFLLKLLKMPHNCCFYQSLQLCYYLYFLFQSCIYSCSVTQLHSYQSHLLAIHVRCKNHLVPYNHIMFFKGVLP